MHQFHSSGQSVHKGSASWDGTAACELISLTDSHTVPSSSTQHIAFYTAPSFLLRIETDQAACWDLSAGWSLTSSSTTAGLRHNSDNTMPVFCKSSSTLFILKLPTLTLKMMHQRSAQKDSISLQHQPAWEEVTQVYKLVDALSPFKPHRVTSGLKHKWTKLTSLPVVTIATHIRLVIMHDHTKFGYKRLSCSEGIFWTKPENRQQNKHTDRRADGQGDF